MNINVDELVKKEIHDQVKLKVNSHFENEVKKVITRSTVKNEIMGHLEKTISDSVNIDEVIAKLDLSKIHNDVVSRVSYAIAQRLDCDEYL